MKIALPLTTRRLLIREFKSSDLSAIQRYASDSSVVRYMVWGPNSLDETRAHLKDKLALQRQVPRNNFDLAVILRANRKLIGSVSLRIGNVRSRAGDFGYVYGREFWGRGFGTEALKALLGFGFEQLRLHRIHATCDRRNSASVRVMEKAGMRREGLRRKDEWVKGRWRDTCIYAILEEEWKSHFRRRTS